MSSDLLSVQVQHRKVIHLLGNSTETNQFLQWKQHQTHSMSSSICMAIDVWNKNETKKVSKVTFRTPFFCLHLVNIFGLQKRMKTYSNIINHMTSIFKNNFDIWQTSVLVKQTNLQVFILTMKLNWQVNKRVMTEKLRTQINNAKCLWDEKEMGKNWIHIYTTKAKCNVDKLFTSYSCVWMDLVMEKSNETRKRFLIDTHECFHCEWWQL